MYNPVEHEIWHQHREELAREISRERQARRLRPARRRPRLAPQPPPRSQAAILMAWTPGVMVYGIASWQSPRPRHT